VKGASGRWIQIDDANAREPGVSRNGAGEIDAEVAVRRCQDDDVVAVAQVRGTQNAGRCKYSLNMVCGC
jgi:hypothetical protein